MEVVWDVSPPPKPKPKIPKPEPEPEPPKSQVWETGRAYKLEIEKDLEEVADVFRFCALISSPFTKRYFLSISLYSEREGEKEFSVPPEGTITPEILLPKVRDGELEDTGIYALFVEEQHFPSKKKSEELGGKYALFEFIIDDISNVVRRIHREKGFSCDFFPVFWAKLVNAAPPRGVSPEKEGVVFYFERR